MPTDWSEDIVLIDFADEPEFSEEMSALFERLKMDAPADSPHEKRAKSARSPPGNTPSIVLNFAQVTYLNSSHLADLLKLRKRMAEGRKSLFLCSLNDDLLTVLRHTGLERVFHIVPDTMTGLAAAQLEQEQRDHPA